MKLWRTQVQIVDISEDKKTYHVIVMGRGAETVAISANQIQFNVIKGQILHALVNAGACREDLVFDQWEPN